MAYNILKLLEERTPMPYEVIPIVERRQIKQIIDQAIQALDKDAVERLLKGKPAVRDAHIRAVALLKGSFTVNPDLPTHLRHGMFEQPEKVFDMILRVSTGIMPEWLPQAVPDAHAIAWKFLDVEGENGFEGANVQDIITTNYPCFSFKDVPAYVRLNKDGKLKFFFPSINPESWQYDDLKLAWNSIKTLIPGIAETVYNSQVPYAFPGNRAIKYIVRPISSPEVRWSAWEHNYLTNKIERQLASSDIYMALYAQVKELDDLLAHPELIENGQTIWQGEEYLLGTIHIPRQEVDRPGRWELAEKISFNPGRGMLITKPVGSIGRLRPPLYARIMQARSRYNAVVLDANGLPTNWQAMING